MEKILKQALKESNILLKKYQQINKNESGSSDPSLTRQITINNRILKEKK